MLAAVVVAYFDGSAEEEDAVVLEVEAVIQEVVAAVPVYTMVHSQLLQYIHIPVEEDLEGEHMDIQGGEEGLESSHGLEEAHTHIQS